MFPQKASDSIFRLIKTITLEQYKYIAAFNDVFGKGTDQWALFELLYYSDQYEEESILAFMAGRRRLDFTLKNLKALKFRTFRWLIRILARVGFATHDNIREIMEGIEILYSRNMYVHAYDLIQEVKPLTLKYELFSWTKELLIRESYIISHTLLDKEQEKYNQAVWIEFDQVKELEENLNGFIQLRLKYLEPARSRYRHLGLVDLNPLEKIVSHDLVKGKGKARSVRAKYLYHVFWLEYHTWKQEIKEGLGHAKSAFGLCEAHPYLIEDNKAEYYRLIKHLMGANSALQHQKEAEKYLLILEKQWEEKPDDTAFLLDKIIWCKFSYWEQFGDLEKGKEAWNLVEKQLPQFERQIQLKDVIFAYFWAIAFLLKTGDKRKAKTQIIKLLRWPKTQVKIDFQIYLRVFHIMLLFEEKDLDLLEREGRNYLNFIRKYKADFLVAFELVNWLRKSPLFLSTDKYAEEVALFKEKLQKLKADSIQKWAFGYFDFDQWAGQLL